MKEKNDFTYLLVLLIFRVILDWSFFLLAKAQFDIEFSLNINYYKIFLSYLVLIVLAVITFDTKRLSSFFFRLILFFTISPLSSVYAMKNENSLFYWSVIVSFFFAEIIALKGKTITNKSILLKGQTKRRSIFIVNFSVFLSILTLVLMYISNGVPKLTTFLLDSVYEVRNSYMVSSYLSYLLFVTTQVIVPFGLADSFSRKKPLLFIFYIFVQLLLFMWTGHKTWLFSILLLIGIMTLIKMKKDLNMLFVGVTIIAFCGCLFFNNEIGFSIFTLINRRVLLDPGALKFFYFDYFIMNNHQTIGVSGTLLAPFFNINLSDSALDYAFLISYKYTDAPSNAVTGLYGGDLANFGIFAFILVPLFLILFSKLVETSSKRSGRFFTIVLFSYLAYAFNDQRIITYFLDFRGIVLILIVLLYSCNFINLLKKEKC